MRRELSMKKFKYLEENLKRINKEKKKRERSLREKEGKERRKELTRRLIDTLLKKGDILHFISRNPISEEIYKTAFNLALQLNDRERMRGADKGLFNIFILKGQHDRGLAWYQSLLEKGEKNCDKVAILFALRGLGFLYRDKNEDEKALACYERQLSVAKEINDKYELSKALTLKALFHGFKGNRDMELNLGKKALELLQEIGDQKKISAGFCNLAQTFDSKKDYDKAIEYYEKALKIDREKENRTRIFWIYSRIAKLYTSKKEYINAIKILEKKLDLSKEWSDKFSVASTIAEMGHVYRQKGDYSTAIEFFEECISLQKELGRTDIDSMYWIGNIHHILGNFDKAVKNYKISYDCFQQSRNTMGVAYLAECFGNLYRDMGDYDKSMAYYDEAIGLTAKTLKRMLPNRLLKKMELLILMESLDEAKFLSEKITNLSRKVGYDYNALFHNLLSVKISFAQGNKTAPNRLYEMLEQTEDENQIAILQYEIWKMNQKEDHRQKALEFYQKLYEKTPKFEYKKRIEELTTIAFYK